MSSTHDLAISAATITNSRLQYPTLDSIQVRWAFQRASRRLVTLQNRIQVELMNRPLGLDVGNWKSLELICGRPVHRGFSPNDKADLFAMLAGNPDDVVGVEPFPKGASS
jgi:hypothetical protein